MEGENDRIEGMKEDKNRFIKRERKVLENSKRTQPNSSSEFEEYVQGVPKVVVRTFGLNAQPSAEFLTPNFVNILPEALIRRFNHKKFEISLL